MAKKQLIRKITWIKDRDINGNYGYRNTKTGEFRTTLPNSKEQNKQNQTRLNKAILRAHSHKLQNYENNDANRRNHSDEVIKKTVNVPYLMADKQGNFQEGTVKTLAPGEDSFKINSTLEGLFIGDKVFRLGSGLIKIALAKTGNNYLSHWARNSLLNEAAKGLTKNFSSSAIFNGENLVPEEAFLGDNSIQSMSYYKPMRRAWTNGNGEGNAATSYFFKQQPDQRFELVKDIEPNNYSVHFKTDQGALNYGQKMQLFAKVADEVPEGANLSTWGSVSKGGIHGINRFGKNFGFIQNGTRQLTMKGTKEPVEVGVFQKPLNHHLQGEDAIKMFKEYGGTPIPEGSLNGDQLRKYVIEARERYGLMDNPNISDEEIAQALYKHTNELGKGSAAINSQGEPQLLFRGDTKAYTQLKDRPSPTDLATKSGTMDNSLGTLFLGELPGTGQKGQGLERYLVRGQEFNGDPKLIGSGTGAKVLGGDGKYHTEIGQIIPKDARPLVTYPTRFGDIAVYKLPAKYSESKTNNINAFVVRTPAVRDASKEISVLNDDWLIKGGSKVNYHGPLNPTNERSAMAEHYNYVLKDAQKKQQGLLKSNPNSPLRDEHDDYTYFAVPNWNKSNVKSLLPYDLRIPRNWSDSNIFRIAAPVVGVSLLNNNK